MLLGLKGWFAALSLIGKAGVVTGATVATLTTAAIVERPTPSPAIEPPPQVQSAVVEQKTETSTEAIPFATTEVSDPSSNLGVISTQIEGVDGVKTKTWNVTYTDGIETNRMLTGEEITAAPINKVVARGTYVAPAKPTVPPGGNCDPNYSGACVPIASDVDCGGGSGNGPAYLYGTATVIGYDIYGLDRDVDGLACE